MNISEQVKELRNYERIFKGDRLDGNLSPIFGSAADTTESLSAKLQSGNCGGGWIPCDIKRMPHGGSTVLIRLRSTSDGITGDDDRTYDISYLRTIDNEWVSTQGTYPFDAVVAWKPIEPYHEP